jgi:hypothetical protein
MMSNENQTCLIGCNYSLSPTLVQILINVGLCSDAQSHLDEGRDCRFCIFSNSKLLKESNQSVFGLVGTWDKVFLHFSGYFQVLCIL